MQWQDEVEKQDAYLASKFQAQAAAQDQPRPAARGKRSRGAGGDAIHRQGTKKRKAEELQLALRGQAKKAKVEPQCICCWAVLACPTCQTLGASSIAL